MWRFSLMGIPVGVEWFFWLTAALLGGAYRKTDPQGMTEVAVWVAIVFVSIIVHELGHALAGRRFGVRPAIRLHGLGGLTLLPGARFSRPQSIGVSAAGPAAGIALGVVFWLLWQAGFSRGFAGLAVYYGLQINFFWTAINLLPIPPLDGGQILRDLLGPSRVTLTHRIGFAVAAVAAGWALLQGLIFLGILLAFFGWSSLRHQSMEGGVASEWPSHGRPGRPG